MTPRRSIAIILLVTCLLTLTPVRTLTATAEAFTGYVPVMQLGGQSAMRGNTMYAVGYAGLLTYDLSTLQVLDTRSFTSVPAMVQVLEDRLYVASKAGDLLAYDISQRTPKLQRSLRISGFTLGYDATVGPLKRVDASRLLLLAGDTLYLVNEVSGVTEWSWVMQSEQEVTDFQLLGNLVFYQAKSRSIVGVELAKGQVFATEGERLCQVTPGTAPSALYFTSMPDDHINRLTVSPSGTIAATTWLTESAYGLTLHDNKLFYNSGKSGSFVGYDFRTGNTAVYADGHVADPQWFSEDDFAFRSGSSMVREYRNGKTVWASSWKGSSYWDEMTAQAADAFVVRNPEKGSWLFQRAPGMLEQRQLYYGQSHMWTFEHREPGPLALNISSLSQNPHLVANVQVYVMHADGTDWKLLQETELTRDSGVAVRIDYNPVQVMLLVTAGPESNWDPVEQAHYPASKLPINYSANYSGLTPGQGRPPELRITDPWPALELWGDSRTSVAVGIETESGQWIYPTSTELPAQADQNGKLQLELPVGQELISTLQFLANDGEQISLATIPVVRHWVRQRPGEPPLLSRSPAFKVQVPDASLVDLSNSELLVNGMEVSLHADLQQNIVYGVPSSSLYTGLVTLNLVLIGNQRDANQQVVVLDSLSWRQEIVGKRVAELWPGKATATINGETEQLEAAPYIHAASSSTMLPFRFIADTMGAQVGWNSSTRQVTFKLDEQTIVLTMGSRVAKVNGKSVTMSTAPVIQNGRTMVPLRFVSENLGASVHWDNASRRVIIKVDEHVFNDLPPTDR